MAEALAPRFTPYAVEWGSDLPVAGGPACGLNGQATLAQGFYPTAIYTHSEDG